MIIYSFLTFLLFSFPAVHNERPRRPEPAVRALPRGRPPAHQPRARGGGGALAHLPPLPALRHRPALVRAHAPQAQGAARQAPLQADRLRRAGGAQQGHRAQGPQAQEIRLQQQVRTAEKEIIHTGRVATVRDQKMGQTRGRRDKGGFVQDI